jgi:predicted site-specific integrase-resolvase
MPMPQAKPIFDFKVPFAAVLGIRHETLRRYIKLGVIAPDAQTTSGRALFLADAASLERHKESIMTYKRRIAQSRHNVVKKELIK